MYELAWLATLKTVVRVWPRAFCLFLLTHIIFYLTYNSTTGRPSVHNDRENLGCAGVGVKSVRQIVTQMTGCPRCKKFMTFCQFLYI